MRTLIVGLLAASTLATPALALSEKAKTVATVFGVLSYAQDACSDLSVDHAAVVKSMEERGIDFEDMRTDPGFKSYSVGVYIGLSRDSAKACAMIRRNFGPDGETVRGLVSLRG